MASLRLAHFFALVFLLALTVSRVSHAQTWLTGHVEAGLPDAMSLQDVTSTAFSSRTATSTLLTENLRVLAQGDWLNNRRTAFLATQASAQGHRVLQLWQNTGEDEALNLAWSSAPLPTTTTTTTTAVYIVSAVCADTLRRGVLDVIVQSSDGRLYFVDGTVLRLAVSGSLPSRGDAVLQPLALTPAASSPSVDLTMKESTVPLLSLATLRSPCHAPDLLFVNSHSEIVILTSISETPTDASSSTYASSSSGCVYETMSAETSMLSASQATVRPLYEARRLLSDDTVFTWRTAGRTTSDSPTARLHTVPYHALTGTVVVTDPAALALHDVNEDCAAELLFTLSGIEIDDEDDADSTGGAARVYVAAYASATDSVTLLLALPTATPDGSQSVVYGVPLWTDMNGDGLVDLVLPARLSAEDATLPQGSFNRLHLFFNTRSNTTTYLGGHCAAATAEASARIVLGMEASSVADPIFTVAQSTLYTFPAASCGAASNSVASTVPLAFSQLQSVQTQARIPLLLREGDFNRDHLTDLLIPSNYGPLLLASMSTRESQSAAVPYRTSAMSHKFYCRQVDPARADQLFNGSWTSSSRSSASSSSSSYRSTSAAMTHGDVLQYQYSTPFFTSLGSTVGQLHIGLSLLDPLMASSLTGTNAPTVSAVTRLYKVTNTPLQRYFLHLADLTRNAVEMSAMADVNRTLVHADALTKWGKEVPYGVCQIGAVHRFGWQDTRMKEHWAVAVQGARTSGHDLSLPRPLLGLGSTFSYVHDYTVGGVVCTRRNTSSDDSSNSSVGATAVLKKQWPSYLVPNTQLFAVQEPVALADKWTLKLYLPTSQYRTLLLVTLAVILVVLGIPIACLRWNEIRSDYKEWNNRI